MLLERPSSKGSPDQTIVPFQLYILGLWWLYPAQAVAIDEYAVLHPQKKTRKGLKLHAESESHVTTARKARESKREYRQQLLACNNNTQT